jgi:hypothetical protein
MARKADIQDLPIVDNLLIHSQNFELIGDGQVQAPEGFCSSGYDVSRCSFHQRSGEDVKIIPNDDQIGLQYQKVPLLDHELANNKNLCDKEAEKPFGELSCI